MLGKDSSICTKRFYLDSDNIVYVRVKPDGLWDEIIYYYNAKLGRWLQRGNFQWFNLEKLAGVKEISKVEAKKYVMAQELLQ